MPRPWPAARRFGHELKQVLTEVSTAAENLMPALSCGDAGAHVFGGLRRALAQADHLVDSLLDEHRTFPAERPLVDLIGYLDAREPWLRLLVPARILLNLQPRSAGCAILAHPDELDEILSRLIQRACDAMPESGELTVTTGWLLIGGDDQNGDLRARRHCRLTVADTGTGQAAETADRFLAGRIHEMPGVEADLPLGAMVHRLGGSLLLECTAGEGSRVHVCFPDVADR